MSEIEVGFDGRRKRPRWTRDREEGTIGKGDEESETGRTKKEEGQSQTREVQLSLYLFLSLVERGVGREDWTIVYNRVDREIFITPFLSYAYK